MRADPGLQLFCYQNARVKNFNESKLKELIAHTDARLTTSNWPAWLRQPKPIWS